MQIGLSKLPTPPATIRSNQNSILEITLLLIIAGVFYYFLVSPKKAEIETKNATIVSLEAQSKLYTVDNDKIKKLSADLKKNRENFKKLDQALPLNSKITSVYLLFEELSARSAVTINDINISADSDVVVAADKEKLADPFKGTRSLGTMLASFSVNAKFDSFQTFLNQLENSGRIININSIEVTSSQEDRLTFRVSANIYYYE
jgi:Tfp pilus assembly protein PilO